MDHLISLVHHQPAQRSRPPQVWSAAPSGHTRSVPFGQPQDPLRTSTNDPAVRCAQQFASRHTRAGMGLATGADNVRHRRIAGPGLVGDD